MKIRMKRWTFEDVYSTVTIEVPKYYDSEDISLLLNSLDKKFHKEGNGMFLFDEILPSRELPQAKFSKDISSNTLTEIRDILKKSLDNQEKALLSAGLMGEEVNK